MPKLKTKQAAAKRIKINKNGQIKTAKANKRHILSSKPKKRKRQLRSPHFLGKADEKRIAILMPYA